MKSFILNIIFFLTPLFLLVIIANIYGDASNLFHGNSYEKKIAELWLKERNVSIQGNYDEAKFQLEIIKSPKIKPNIIVLGSSRSMLLRQEFITTKNEELINHSVSSVDIKTMLDLYKLYKDYKKQANEVIINLDPWNFSSNERFKRGLENHSKLKKFEKYKQLLSLSYFQESWKFFRQLIKGKGIQAYSSGKKYNKNNTKLKDNSLVYRESMRTASLEEIQIKVNKRTYSREDFKKIIQHKWDTFLSLTMKLKDDNVKIKIFLSTYHPDVYDKLTKKYPIVLEIEKRIRQFAREKNIIVYGSYNPYLLGLKKENFYDGMHAKEIGIKKAYNFVLNSL